jgi:hypothetical protein
VGNKTQNKTKNNLNHDKLIKESLRELLGNGLVEGKERKTIDRTFLFKYAVSAKLYHLGK